MEQIERCDVCIVGAGICGLNALFVASQYLHPGQRAILIDQRERAGGMWVDTYDYVRLHQPHPFFTAGNIAWALDRERAHLATKPEVLDHFAHCLDVIRQRITVDEYFCWTMQSAVEEDTVVRVTCRNADGRELVVQTARLIKAHGADVQPNEPLPVSSASVHSVSPDFCDVRREPINSSDAPVWVIGGGKTAMDTAHALITAHPGRQVNLLAGSGTYFARRDRMFPAGAGRWWGGLPLGTFADELTRRFDGTNERQVAQWCRERCGVWLTPTTGNYLLGVLSTAENETIAAGLSQVVMDHFVDVVDRDRRTEMLLRTGATRPIDPGSWIVNCTGYLLRNARPYEPHTTPSGRVLSINSRSATLHLTTYMGYFLTHLMFTGQLAELPLYELDMLELRRKSNAVLPYTLMTLAQHNMSLMTDALPTKVFRDCGLDFERWYPLPRRAVGMTRFLATHHKRRPHLQRTLDTVAERFDVRCAPLRLLQPA
jgi:hypothetical protein